MKTDLIAPDRWVERARAVPIENELARRGIKLHGKAERCGPCPKCGGDDRFSINIKKQLFNCRGCEVGGDVIDFVQWFDSVGFIEACTTLAGPPPKNGKDHAAAEPRRVRIATYCYHDESGALLFKVERHEYRNPDGSFVLKDGKRKKAFAQRRPAPNKPGEWINNVDGVRIVPYRLPELIETIANGYFVTIVEGEAKADLLWSWNVPATCNAMGSGKWRPEHSEFLRGADAVITPDNDESGRNHADVVAASLQGIANSVRLLELPGLGPKQDIIDWAKQGGTVEQLHDLIAQQAKPWAPRAKPEQQAADNKTEATEAAVEGVSVEDFYAYMPMHSYIYAPTREMWPASSVNARVPPPAKGIKASLWLDQHRPVEQMTWAPGEPMLIANRLISEGGWIERNGVTCFNLYRPPTIKPGTAAKANPWRDHVSKVFGGDADHILKWLAHRVQLPADKINHALVLGGAQGIGKDSLLEPVKRAIGPWNFHEVSPQHMLGRFNGFVKSVILRVSEARDLGDVDRFQFYDHSKSYIAAPPDVLRVDEKHIREHAVLNCLGVIITSNHKTDGIYLPADDRRHFVAWSDLTKEQFEPDYWTKLWDWYRCGGDRHVAAFLAELDLASFDAKAPPPKTQAFWEIVDSSRAPEDAELADAIDVIGSPAALTLSQIAGRAADGFADWLRDRKNARRIPHRLEACGYVAVRNDDAKDGLWKVLGKRQVIYAKAELSLRDRICAAQEVAGMI